MQSQFAMWPDSSPSLLHRACQPSPPDLQGGALLTGFVIRPGIAPSDADIFQRADHLSDGVTIAQDEIHDEGELVALRGVQHQRNRFIMYYATKGFFLHFCSSQRSLYVPLICGNLQDRGCWDSIVFKYP